MTVMFTNILRFLLSRILCNCERLVKDTFAQLFLICCMSVKNICWKPLRISNYMLKYTISLFLFIKLIDILFEHLSYCNSVKFISSLIVLLRKLSQALFESIIILQMERTWTPARCHEPSRTQIGRSTRHVPEREPQTSYLLRCDETSRAYLSSLEQPRPWSQDHGAKTSPTEFQRQIQRH